jgi:hypothetical protein
MNGRDGTRPDGRNERRDSPLQLRSFGPEGRWWMRRRSLGKLYWHSYKTFEAREKASKRYYDRNDQIWMRSDGTDSSLFFVRDEEQWHP